MRPRSQGDHDQLDLFRAHFDQLLNPNHPLVILSQKIDWARFDAAFAEFYSDDMGAPAKATRLLVALHYLKHAFSESDESLVARWVENPYWQYFCGFTTMQHELPLHPTTMVKWRKRVGADKLAMLLQETIALALREKQVSPQELQQVNVDTTVQEKNITYPTDSNLFYKAIVKLAKAAKSRGVRLRQSYVRVAKIAAIKASRCAHAKQFRRMQRQLRFLRTRLGRVLRDFGRMVAHPDEALRDLLKLCWRLFRQQPQDKHKLYSLDEPEVECISKGKAHKRYEFGQKISIATTNRRNWVLAAMLCPDNPYDGHTLQATLAAAERNSGVRPTAAFVDKGYRGHGCHGDTQIHIAGASNKDASRILRKRRRRRSAIEPLIGHMKSDHRMGRCFLKGLLGDAINAVLAAAGTNFRKLLRCVFALIFGLVWAAAWWKRPSRCVPRLAAAA
jgi:IS5 family transposase